MTDELVANITNKLDQICAQEPVISIGLENLKSSVDALEKAGTTAASLQIHATQTHNQQIQSPRVNRDVTVSQQPDNALTDSSKHKQKPVAHFGADFITEDFERQLIAFLESKADEFVTEGDRSTLSFGEQ